MFNTKLAKHILYLLVITLLTPFVTLYALIIDYKQFTLIRELWDYALHPNEQ